MRRARAQRLHGLGDPVAASRRGARAPRGRRTRAGPDPPRPDGPRDEALPVARRGDERPARARLSPAEARRGAGRAARRRPLRRHALANAGRRPALTGEQKRSRLPQPLRWAVSSWKAAVAVAGGIATILALFFTLFPEAKPAEPCRGRLGGTLSEITVDERVRYAAYLELEGASASGIGRDQLERVGRVVHFTIETHGYKDERLPIYWWLLTNEGEPVDDPELRRQLAFEIAPEDCQDGGRRKMWVPLPRQAGTYKVEVRLFAPSGGALDDIRTEPFAVETGA